jgi:2-desacetyl-2-hydroxyethyl bacteriochlorophyllide A dehydrogenase
MCELLSVPARNVVAAAGLSLDQAAMLEFLAIGAHGVRRSQASAQDRVLVVGAGPIGIAAAIFAQARGAEVTALDFNKGRLAFCRDVLGVAQAVEAGSGARERLAEITAGDFYDVVIDATGSPAAMRAGFGLVAHGGRYVLLSIVQAEIGFDDPEFHKRETTLLSSRNATREDFATVAEAIRAGRVPTGRLATHRAPLAEAAAAIPLWARPETGTIKALVQV